MADPKLNSYQQNVAQWREILQKNRKKTLWVMACFILIYMALGLLFDLVIYSAQIQAPLSAILKGLLTGQLMPRATLITGFIALISLGITLLFHRQLILSGTQYKQVTGKSDDPAEQQLYNVVEEMKIAAGMPFMPKVYVIEADYMNAFASGYNEKSALIAVTRGLMHKLNRDELQAVMAHELSHIRHLDIRLTLIASVLSNLLLMLVDVLFWSMIMSGNKRNNNRDNGNGALLLAVYLLRYLMPLITLVLMMFLSRSREYMADAGAVELQRDNEPLASALLKIQGDHVDNKQAYNIAYSQTAHEAVRREAYIFDPLRANIEVKHSLTDFFSTHPSISKRLAAIGFKRKESDSAKEGEKK